MNVDYPELSEALEEVLGPEGERDEFRRRLAKLVANVISGNAADSDVRDVIRLAPLPANDGADV